MNILLNNKIILLVSTIVLILSFIITPFLAQADFNQQINYQGKLTDSSGVAVADGTYNMNFWLLASSTAATSTAVWSEVRTTGDRVQVTNGLFSVMLGEVSSLSSVDFNQTLYLGVEIGGTSVTPTWDGEMSPRKILGAVPAAFEASNAQTLDNLATTSFLRSDAIDTMEATSSSALLTLIQNGAGKLLSLFSGATEMFTVLNNGNVGIATTTPSEKLTVIGNSYLNGSLTLTGALKDSTSATGTLGMILKTTGTSTQWVATSTLGLGNGTFLGLTDTPSSFTANRLMFTNSGGTALTDSANLVFDGTNFGIGTSTPNTKLHLYSNDSQYGSSITLQNGYSSSYPFLRFHDSNESYSYAIGLDDTQNKFVIGYSADGNATSITSPRLVIDTSGYVGIGTTTPNENLHIYSSASSAAINLQAATNKDSRLSLNGDRGWVLTNDGDSSLGGADYFHIYDNTAASSRLVIDTSGYVGIGTTTPNSKLTVAGDINISDTSTGYKLGNNRILYASTTNFSTLVGNGAGQALLGDGLYNTALGYQSLYAATSSDNNTAVGNLALYSNTAGNSNTALGYQSLRTNTTGSSNTAFGSFSLYSNITGVNNTANGYASLYSTTGSYNTAFGYNAGRYLTDGTSAASTTDYSLFLGYNTKALTDNDQNAIVIGYNADSLGSNTVVLGNDSIVTTALKGNIGIGTTTPSDKLTVVGNSYLGGGLTLTGALKDSTSATGTLGMILKTTGTSTQWVATSTLGLGNGTFLGLTDTPSSFTANRLIFTNSGATALTDSASLVFDGTNFGIGTTTPSAKLSVKGVGTTTGRAFAVSDSADTERFTVLDNGRVGIGTTTPLTKLNIYDSSSLSMRIDTNSYASQMRVDAGGVFWEYGTPEDPDNFFTLNASAGRNNIDTKGRNFRISSTADTTGLNYLASSGNFGIGTTTPSEKLTVIGNTYLNGGLTLTGALKDSTSATGTLGMILKTTGTSTQWVATSTLGFGNGTFLGLTDTPSSFTANRLMFTNSGATALTDSADLTFDGTNFGVGSQNGIAFGGTRYLYASSTNDSVAFGENAGASFKSSTIYNVAIGFEAGRYASSTDTDRSNLIGYQAGYNNIGAYNNIIGSGAGHENTGWYNNIIGVDAGYQNTGDDNNFIGDEAGYQNTGSDNEMIGHGAGRNLQSTSSVIIGSGAYRGGAGTTAFQAINNTALGYRAGYAAQTGASNNILLGYQAADNLTTGANNIVIGYDVDIASTTRSNQLNIGNLIFGTGIDGTGTTLSSGNIGIGTTTPSDKLTVVGNSYLGGGLTLTGALKDSTSATGTLGMILKTTGTSTQWVATSTLGLGNGTFLGLTDTPSSFTANRLMFTNSGATALTDSASLVFDGTNFGIGTSTPGNKLTVAGDINISDTSTGYKLGNNRILYASTTNFSTLVGNGAGQALLGDGLYNTALGYQSLYAATSSDDNIAIGFQSLYNNTSGGANVALGNRSLYNNTTGNYNTANGSSALYSNTTGSFNTANGVFALYSNITGSSNTALGYQSLYSATSSDDNTALGYQSLYSNTAGINNSAIGYQSLYFNTEGNFNTANGYQSLRSNTTGSSNAAFGARALYSNATGTLNVAVGRESLYSNTSGDTNTATGYRSLYSNTTGSNNTAVGHLALFSNATGTSNIAIGRESLYFNTGSHNIAIGLDALYNNINGDDNTVVGYKAGSNVNSANNILLGYQAADNLTTGANNIVIGYDVDIASTTRSNQLNIGNLIFGTGVDGTGTSLSSGNIGIGTTTPGSRFAIEKLTFTGAGVAGITQNIRSTNVTASAVQYGNFGYLYASNTATTTIAGNMFKIEDNTTFGNTIRGFEVQTDRGINTLGENTALSGFARTFGVRGTTKGDAGGTYEPAGVFAETMGTTQGNAIRGYSSTITSASLLKLFQDSSTFTGTGLQMNFGNSGGSFSSTTASKFIDLQNAGTSMFTVGAYGKLTIGDGTTNNNAGIQVGYGGICVDNDGSCNASTTGRISAVSYHTGNSDLAETYFSNENLKAGEVVYIKGGLSVGRAGEDNKDKVIGVVSTKPGLLLGFDDTSLKAGEKSYPIALKGRVPVRLSTENGEIKAGDELMLSSIPGAVMKASSTGKIVGMALEDFDGSRAYSDTYINQFGDDLVDPVFEPISKDNDPRINDGCYFGGGNASGDEVCIPLVSTTTDGQIAEAEALARREAEERALARLANVSSDNVTLGNGQQVQVGQIVMFVDLRNRTLDEVGTEMILAFTAQASSTDNNEESETVWQRLLNLANNFVDGVLSVFTLKADKVEVKDQLCVDGVCVTGDDLRKLLNKNQTTNTENNSNNDNENNESSTNNDNQEVESSEENTEGEIIEENNPPNDTSETIVEDSPPESVEEVLEEEVMEVEEVIEETEEPEIEVVEEEETIEENSEVETIESSAEPTL